MTFVPGELTKNSSGDHSRCAYFVFSATPAVGFSVVISAAAKRNLCPFAPEMMHLHAVL
jgi:hypothetical protein